MDEFVDSALKKRFPTWPARWLDEPWLLALSVAGGTSTTLGLHFGLLDGAQASTTAGMLAGGLLAMLGIGASSAAAALSAVLSHDWLSNRNPNRPPPVASEVRVLLEGVVATYWHNLRAMMVQASTAFVASVVASAVSTVGESALPSGPPVASSVAIGLVVACTVGGIGRWWRLNRSLMNMSITIIQVKIVDPEQAQADPTNGDDGGGASAVVDVAVRDGTDTSPARPGPRLRHAAQA